MNVETHVLLPEPVAREAEELGLLTPENLERLLREEIRRRRVGQLFDVADRLGRLPGPALTTAEVEAEVQAARSERRAGHARGG